MRRYEGRKKGAEKLLCRGYNNGSEGQKASVSMQMRFRIMAKVSNPADETVRQMKLRDYFLSFPFLF